MNAVRTAKFRVLATLGLAVGLASPIANAAPPTAAPASVATTLSVYAPEPDSPDWGKSFTTCGYFEKTITQEYLGAGRYAEFGMNQGIGDEVTTDCAFPKGTTAKKSISIQKRAKQWLKDDLRPGDVVVIPPRAQWEKYESNDGSFGRSVTARWYSKAHAFSFNQCGARSGTVCEASGSKTARAINLAHFRIEAAQKAKDGGNRPLCTVNAKHALAISRGLPKFRKNLKSSGDWVEKATYKTRWDGVLTEDAAFKKMDEIGVAAAKLYTDCAGGSAPATTEAEEMSFKG